MSQGKWITDLAAMTPLVDAARRALSIRFEAVHQFLGLALREADKDPEHLHRLRVSTRRAGAALDIFALCLSDNIYSSARKQLRRLRRAAGEARDWDVFLMALGEEKQKHKRHHRAGLDFLTGHDLGQRLNAQVELAEAGSDYPFSFERLQAETVADVNKPRYDRGTRTLRDLAGPLLLGLLRDFDQAAAADLVDYERLHRVRILGKRLRYAMEIFADCFAAPFREKLYPAVEEMQEILGRANDSNVASRHLAALREKIQILVPHDWKRLKPGIEGLLKQHEHRLATERLCFLAWRKRWQKSGGEAAFRAILKRSETAVG
jgi:CHAD domain-containing protein